MFNLLKFIQATALTLGVYLLADYIAIERRTWHKRCLAVPLSLFFGVLMMWWGRIIFILMLIIYLGYYTWRQKQAHVLTELVKFCLALNLQLIFSSLAVISATAAGKLWPLLATKFSNVLLIISTDYLLIASFIVLLHYLKLFATITNVFRQTQVQKYLLALLLLTFCALAALLWLIDYYHFNTASKTLLIFGFSGLILLAAFLFTYFLKIYHLRSAQLMAQRDYQNILLYAQEIAANDRALRKFKHDYQNILLSLQTYIDESQQPELQHYFQQILKSASLQLKPSNHFADLDLVVDKPLRSLLLQKLAQAQLQHITVHLEITTRFQLNQPVSITLIRMLGIILDNALEAAQSAASPKLQVALLNYANGDQEIIVTNNFNTAPNFSRLFKAGYSQKGTQRGTGLANLQELAQQQPHILLDVKQTTVQFRVILTFMEAPLC